MFHMFRSPSGDISSKPTKNVFMIFMTGWERDREAKTTFNVIFVLAFCAI